MAEPTWEEHRGGKKKQNYYSFFHMIKQTISIACIAFIFFGFTDKKLNKIDHKSFPSAIEVIDDENATPIPACYLLQFWRL